MKDKDNILIMPVLPLRDVVVYPHMVIPLFVGRSKSIKALDVTMTEDKRIFLVAQKDPNVDEPTTEDFYEVGTVSTVLQLLKLPDGTVKVLVEGNQRAKILSVKEEEEDYYSAEIEVLHDDAPSQKELNIVIRSLLSQFEQ